MRNTVLVYAGHIDTMSPTETAYFFRAARKQGAAIKVRKSEIDAFAENEAPHKEIETVFSFYHYGIKVFTVFAYKVKEAPKADRAFNSDSKRDADILAASMAM